MLFTFALSPKGRQNIAQGVSPGNWKNGRKAPERGGRVGPEHLTPLRGWIVFALIPTACAVGYSLTLLRS